MKRRDFLGAAVAAPVVLSLTSLVIGPVEAVSPAVGAVEAVPTDALIAQRLMQMMKELKRDMEYALVHQSAGAVPEQA